MNREWKAEQTLSIVIPCYNEEESIPQLVQRLIQPLAELQKDYLVELIFVDDGSTDKTNKLLHQNFENIPRVKIIQHEKNKNLGAALRTGFSHTTGNYVAVLDSDCTYNPLLLRKMLNLMDENTDVVTVSPYHPLGKVRNVPIYRIFLSKSASFCYRLFLDWKLYTYTAMVRVYRREVIRHIRFEADNFLGVTELLVKAMLQGYKVKELPAELSVRKFGQSKMKALPIKVIISHLGLLSGILRYKFRKKFSPKL